MFGHWVMSDSLWPHGLQHARLPCPSPSPMLKLMPTELVMPSNHLILSCPPFLPPSIFPCIRVFPSESALCIRCPKFRSFSFSISSSNEYSGLISLIVDWFDLLAVQGTLKSLPQHHSSKASVLQRSTFFMVQLSHPYFVIVNFWTLIKFSYVEFSGIFSMYKVISLNNNYFVFSFWSHVPYISFSFFFFCSNLDTWSNV